MTGSHPEDRPAPVPLADLFTRYLQKQAHAQAHGLGLPDPLGLVEPYDASPVRPADPRLAWEDARAVLGHYPGVEVTGLEVPPDWPTLVAGQESAVDLAFCLGNFPQMVRHLQPLLAGEAAALRRPRDPQPAEAPALLAWADGQTTPAGRLLAVGTLRLAGHLTVAGDLLARSGDSLPGPWQPVWDNEAAALAWQRGEGEKALEMWRQQGDSVPARFNRGMAALFLGHPDEARDSLTAAAAALSDTCAWHHLAQLYLALT